MTTDASLAVLVLLFSETAMLGFVVEMWKRKIACKSCHLAHILKLTFPERVALMLISIEQAECGRSRSKQGWKHLVPGMGLQRQNRPSTSIGAAYGEMAQIRRGRKGIFDH